MQKELPKRKATRLRDFSYNTAGAYFITICTLNREHILSQIVGDNEQSDKLGIVGSRQNSVVSSFVSTFKRFCNKECGYNIWQRHFNDHIIRNQEDYETHLRYILENPMRWHFDELYSNNILQ